ncbi:MAG: hypothetical protein QOE45_1297 [Frankiaceae bacterium]|jgi:hypothetical protein|nr:hypothetical protein [Frankiaceae bacterium]
MPPTSAAALLVLLVSVLPGSLYMWAFERQASAYGVTLADRVLRFIGVSVAFDLLLAWPAYATWRAAFAGRPFGGGQFALAWVSVAVGFALPASAGTVIGGLYSSRAGPDGWPRVRRLLGRTAERRLLLVAHGRGREPRAWDDLFTKHPTCFVKIKTVDGWWQAGWFGRQSSVGRFPHDSDIWLERAWPINADGHIGDRPYPYGVYVPANRIAWIEVLEETAAQEAPCASA